VKQPRLDVRDALNRPAAKTLFGLLLRNDSPIRMREAREQLKLSIGQFGLAMRSLERHGLAQRRNFAEDAEASGAKLQHPYIEATDLGREHGQGLGENFFEAPNP
jgi:DNA-binding MarR family transcriptional regulator